MNEFSGELPKLSNFKSFTRVKLLQLDYLETKCLSRSNIWNYTLKFDFIFSSWSTSIMTELKLKCITIDHFMIFFGNIEMKI